MIVFFAAKGMMSAQVPNSGFENLNTDGSIKNWGAPFFTIIEIDSTGVAHPDSIVYDNQLYFSTSDAHAGLKALEMRNAYYYTSGQKITGSARVSENDSDYAAFSSLISLTQQPVNFTFYYKFLPAGNDTAVAMLYLYDSNSNPVGEAIIEITSASSTYTLASKPVTYYTSNNPLPFFATVEFTTAKYGSTSTFGTRFLVDDVNLAQLATGIWTHDLKNNGIRCFPNPAEKQLTIQLDETITTDQNIKVQITDVSGKLIQRTTLTGNTTIIDTKELDKGLYAVTIITPSKTYHSKFFK